MTDLITRLEQAESGSRELSDAVLLALGWRVDKEDWPGGFEPVQVWWTPNKTIQHGPRPSPTESVDDALVLVPEGQWEAASYGQYDNSPRAGLWRNLHNENVEFMGGEAATPALALCIAILKAQEGEKR